MCASLAKVLTLATGVDPTKLQGKQPMPIKTAVITGAAAGIGAALARHLSAQGTQIVLADVELDKAEAQAAQIREAGGHACALFVDQGNPESIDTLATQVRNWMGAPALVLVNAGVGAGGALHTTPKRNVDWVLNVNLFGPIEMARAFVPMMVEANVPSRFALTASEHALGLPRRGGSASIYTVSKHGALGVAETLRRDLTETCVAVSVICPAIVNSEIWNTMRNRPDHLGGPRLLGPEHRPDPAQGLSCEVAASRIADGLEAGEFYIFTHGADVAEVHRARANEVDLALARFAMRYGGEA
jgi:NAD(P)-dependent dehydrogenase (short-subunit alcohol dehydrogenase family)